MGAGGAAAGQQPVGAGCGAGSAEPAAGQHPAALPGASWQQPFSEGQSIEQAWPPPLPLLCSKVQAAIFEQASPPLPLLCSKAHAAVIAQAWPPPFPLPSIAQIAPAPPHGVALPPFVSTECAATPPASTTATINSAVRQLLLPLPGVQQTSSPDEESQPHPDCST